MSKKRRCGEVIEALLEIVPQLEYGILTTSLRNLLVKCAFTAPEIDQDRFFELVDIMQRECPKPKEGTWTEEARRILAGESEGLVKA